MQNGIETGGLTQENHENTAEKTHCTILDKSKDREGFLNIPLPWLTVCVSVKPMPYLLK